MLSPDVPEFVPRGCQTPDSTNAVNTEPKESTSQAQFTKSSPGIHRPSSVPKSSSWRGAVSGSRAPNDSWRRPKEVSGDQQDSQTQDTARHESGTEMNQGERHTSQRGKGKLRPVTENLELHIRNKFTTPKPSYSYTKILKSKQPVNSASVPEAKSVKQDFSFSNDSHWPTLGESLPLYKTPEKTSKTSETEKRDSNAWVRKSDESSPTKFFKNPWEERGMAEQTTEAFITNKTTETNSPLKSPRKNANPWQERSTPEYNEDTSVRPKSTEISNSTKKSPNTSGHVWQQRSTSEQFAGDSVRSRITDGSPKTPDNAAKTKPPSHTQQKRAETNSRSDNSSLENKKSNLPKDKSNEYDKEQSSQKSYARTAMNAEVKENQEVSQASKQTTQDDSELFQWQVIGEKKNKVKKPKIKPEELESSQFPKLARGDSNKHGRVLSEKPAQDDKTKENQENINKKHVVDSPKNKGANPTSTQETSEGAIRKDTKKLNQKEKKKLRPTRVTSLANCSSGEKELRTNPKAATTSTTTPAAAAAKPLSEEALQKKLAFKLMKKEEKMRKRELKCLQARMASRDTKVSVISSDFLEKTQVTSKAPTQPTSQIQLTFEEYPSLQMQRKVTKRDIPQTPSSLPPHIDAHQDSPSSLPPDTSGPQASPNLQTTTDMSLNSEKPTATSQKVRLKGDNLLLGLLPVNASDDDGDDGLEQSAVTYRKALLSAKAKKVAKQDARHSEPPASTRVDAAPPKKQIRTKDPLMLNLQALAAKCRKNKKREAAYLDEKYSPAKRKDDRDDEFPARKPGTAALPKVAGVVAKRGKINAKKPKKKKISRVMKCKIEKRRRETLALQLLLAQANARQQEQQQELLETLSTTNNENGNSTAIKNAADDSDTDEPPHTTTDNETTPENKTQESTDAKRVEEDSATNETPNTATKTETDKEEGERRPSEDEDEEKQESDQEKNEGRTEDSDENKENKSSNKSSPNSNPQVLKPTSDDKPETIWKIKGVQEPNVEDSTPAQDETNKETNTEGKGNSQQSTDEPKSCHSPAQLKLLADDPLVVKKASELIEMLKTQSKPGGPREYCHQVVTPEVNAVAKELISTLMAFQKRHYQRDPTKARIRKRYVCGLKETTKLMGKMSCIIMAPNIQQCEGPGSLDDAVEKLLNQAEKLKVPVVFALSTKEMKYLCRKSSRKVSCFGIINYQGAQDIFQRLMQLMPEAQKQYQELVASGQCSLPKEGEDEEEEEEGEALKKNLTAEVVNHTKSLLMAP